MTELKTSPEVLFKTIRQSKKKEIRKLNLVFVDFVGVPTPTTTTPFALLDRKPPESQLLHGVHDDWQVTLLAASY